ncbi:LETM1-like [Trinorchestia longiramus]|nr:LETM1-like [Trinorchestia longiramus]
MQISRFSSQPSKDPVTQNAPKDNPGATGPTGLLPPPTRSALSQEPRPKGIVGYIISRYTWYIERLQHSLESEMPRTFRMFRIFSVGLKTFIKDFTGYVRVLVKLSFPSERLENLTLHQLQLYHFMPYDMFKVFPVLAISAIPFGQNLALPFGYLFPRQLLCRHFWDLQQSHDFAMRDLRKRVLYARPVFRCLQASVAGIEPLNDRVRMQSVCHLLGSGRHPRDTQVMELRQLFSAAPYGLKNIKRHHVHSLLRLHDLSAVRSRKRLRDHARWLLCHDFALTAEARGVPATDATSQRQDQGVDSSSVEGSGQSTLQQCDLASLHVNVLKTSLLLRGISPIGLDSSGMVRVMERWLAVSLQLSCADSSLLLHLPILLFYNHPTNLALVAR